MFGSQLGRRVSLRSWRTARLSVARTILTDAGSANGSGSSSSVVDTINLPDSDSVSVPDTSQNTSPNTSTQATTAQFTSTPAFIRPSFPPVRHRVCPPLRSIKDTHPGYKDIFMPSRLLMDALTVQLNSRGGQIERRDRAESVERGTVDFKTARATITQRLLKDGDRMITLGEVEGAVGSHNTFVWKTIYSLLKKYESPGIESLTDVDVAQALFERIPSLGKTTARGFAKAGMRTLQDLLDTESIAVKPKVKNYVKLLDVLNRGVPRAEVDEYREHLAAAFRNSQPKLNFTIVGSYRRGASYSTSIKVLVWHDSFERPGQETHLLQEVWRTLEHNGLLKFENMLSGGPNSPPQHMRLSGLTQLDEGRPLRHLEVRLVPTDSKTYRLFWDTGGEWVVKHMVLEAQKRGLHLWPGGMYPLPEQHPPETTIMVDSERELFQLLDVPYLDPHERGPNRAETILPKLRAWSSASRPTADFARRVLAQATVVKPGRVHPTNVPVLIAASRLPLPMPRMAAVPAFPRIDIDGADADIEEVQRRAAASLSRSRFTPKELKRLELERAEMLS